MRWQVDGFNLKAWVIAWFTCLALLVYVPVETYVSWPRGLASPFYLVDLVAMVLMGWGAFHSLRARAPTGAGLAVRGLRLGKRKRLARDV
jgi:hypothetical protein